jgi:hypothetical protein
LLACRPTVGATVRDRLLVPHNSWTPRGPTRGDLGRVRQRSWHDLPVSWFSDFIVTPGAGGVGAVIAASFIGGSALLVSRHRRRDADNDRRSSDRKVAVEQWWTRYTWLVSANSQDLPITGRAEMVAHLIQTAKDLNAPELVTAGEVYRGVVNRALASAIQQRAN